jgi:threonine dehydratase
MDFLHALGQQRNISLFHYRNHGADTARVLVGLQVSPDDKAAFHQALNQMSYGWTEETFNPAYRLFLGA